MNGLGTIGGIAGAIADKNAVEMVCYVAIP